MRRPNAVNRFGILTAVTLILLIGGCLSQTAAQTGKTDREVAGLKGAVRTVLVESGPAAGELERIDQTTYDGLGNVTEYVKYGEKGAVDRKEVYTYDASGKLKEKLSYDGKNTLVGKVVYAYDADGRKIEAVMSDASGKVFSKTVSILNSRGKVTNETKEEVPAIPGFRKTVDYTYDSRIQVIKKAAKSSFDHSETVYEYDSEGRLTGERITDSVGDRTLSYDSEGRVSREFRTFLGKRSSKNYSYDSDDRGNWLKQTATETSADDSPFPEQPSGGIPRTPRKRQVTALVQRTITYYR